MAKIVALVVSDRASAGAYEDKGGPAIKEWLDKTLVSDFSFETVIIPDGVDSVREAITDLCDQQGVDLLLTTGGTGPSPRDLTPEAMKLVLEKELPGFGEQMRKVSLEEVPTAILSRQTAGTRGKTLIINLPGKPTAINTCLNSVFSAVPYCLDLIGAARIETNPELILGFRPKSA